MRRLLHLAVLSAFAAVLLVMGASPAWADPTGSPRAEVVPIDCGAAGEFSGVINGNGTFQPAHDLASTKMLIPVAFGPFSFTVTDGEGSVVDQGTDPAVGKGSATPSGHTLLVCTYSLEETFEGGFTFSGSGSVTGFISGPK